MTNVSLSRYSLVKWNFFILYTVSYIIVCFVGRASLYNLAHKANLVHNFS